MSDIKKMSIAELKEQLKLNLDSKAAMEAAKIPLPQSIAVAIEELESALASKAGDVFAENLLAVVEKNIDKVVGKNPLETGVVMIVELIKQEDGTVAVATKSTKRKVSGSKGGSSSGTRGGKYIHVIGGTNTEADGEHTSGSAALQALRDAKVVAADYGEGNSAPRALEALARQEKITYTRVEAPEDGDGDGDGDGSEES